MMSKTFKGASVFLSRSLVPPEIFDSLHGALKQNGAEVFLCSDPSRNGPNDYHVISSKDHEKFDELQEKGCQLLGPQCVLTCAKEHRPLPKQGFTCCLAMDGVKVLVSGFELDEKFEIGKMVTAMGGALHTKTSLDVNFVIVKNVLAAKYKWASNVLKKPIVTLSWLHQCWIEHRAVPQESYRVLPFCGLTICVTRIPAGERKEMEKLVVQNGGKYSAELTKKSPEGDKYKVAKRWGNILIVSRKWLDQSVARRVCLNEESYPVQRHSASSISGLTTCLSAQQRQDKGQDLEAPLSQNISTTYSDAPISVQKETQDSGAFAKQDRTSASFDGCVADDSQAEDNDMYLSDCRILIVGFDASEMRKLVNMVRRGGGSRYMSLNEKLTHIIVGTPSEIEKKEIRGLAALGVIYVVYTTWLEDCDFEKKEVPVLRRHIAHDLLLPKDLVHSNKGATTGVTGTKQWKASTVQSILPDDQLRGATNMGAWISSEKSNKLEVNINGNSSLRATGNSDTQIQVSAVIGKDEDWQKTQIRSCNDIQNVKSSSVFKGRLVRFSSSFPQDRRAEIIEWVNQGVGEVVDDQTEQDAHFTIECHGVTASPIDASRTTSVSTHWIRSCLEEGCLLEVGSHILYSPLPCQIPLPGFERFRFCVSQYDEKDRLLLRNLCFVLGAKLVEKLTKKVTHLLCKFTSGPKYEAACKWRIQSVTCEWIYECVKQNEIVPPVPFSPREVTSQDQEAGLFTTSQYSQPPRMTFGDNVSQFLSQSLDPRNLQSPTTGRNDSSREDTKLSSKLYKRARILKDDTNKGQLLLVSNQNDPIRKMTSAGDKITQNTGEVVHAMPDVAAAIEDLVEQTSKIHDLKSPWSAECDKSILPSDCSIHGQDHADSHPAFGLSKHWIHRADRKDDLRNPSRDVNVGMYDGFSETQTESQVVGYEEDLSGRQMIIDRVRTQSSTPDTRGQSTSSPIT